MNQGMIQQVAPPAELYRNPVNKFVAGFIGSPTMNFLDVDVLEEDGTVVASWGRDGGFLWKDTRPGN